MFELARNHHFGRRGSANVAPLHAVELAATAPLPGGSREKQRFPIGSGISVQSVIPSTSERVYKQRSV